MRKVFLLCEIFIKGYTCMLNGWDEKTRRMSVKIAQVIQIISLVI